MQDLIWFLVVCWHGRRLEIQDPICLMSQILRLASVGKVRNNAPAAATPTPEQSEGEYAFRQLSFSLRVEGKAVVLLEFRLVF